MSDSDSVSQGVVDGVKDLGTEAVTSTLDHVSPKNIFKTIIGQVVGKNMTEEDEAKKRQMRQLEQEGSRRLRPRCKG